MQTINIAVEGKTTIPLDQLEPFQGDLKRIDRHEYEQLRKNLIENGFSFTIHVWQNEGHNYIIDGHQRLFTLKQMRDVEHWVIPDLPVSLVHADSFAQAKRKILAGTSQYGKITNKGLMDFMNENHIAFEEVASTFKFPEINMDKFAQLFDNLGEAEKLPDVAEGGGEIPEMRSASAGVKQVQLFFDAESHAEFMQKVEDLNAHYGKENVTDAVMEAVREVHSIITKG